MLRVIASSPAEVGAVLNTLVESAARLGEGDMAAVIRAEGGLLQCVAATPPDLIGTTQPSGRGSVNGRVLLEGRTIHTFAPESEHRAEYPDSRAHEFGFQSQVVTPLLRDGVQIGTLLVHRRARRAFTEQQIRLLETFADQAVIAIENARLFEELEQRTSELTLALEQQTATAEILRVIASSPADHPACSTRLPRQPRARSEGAAIQQVVGTTLRWVGLFGKAAERAEVGRAAGIEGNQISEQAISGRALLQRRTIHLPDVVAALETDFADSRRVHQFTQQRSQVSTPLLRDDVAIGVLGVFRWELRAFTEPEIAQLERFADQAVIAIENARLFQELQERVGELQALGEVGQAVSSSLDLQEVLTTIVSNATRLAGADGGIIYEYDEADGVSRSAPPTS